MTSLMSVEPNCAQPSICFQSFGEGCAPRGLGGRSPAEGRGLGGRSPEVAGDAHRLAAPAGIHPGPPDPGRGRCSGRQRLMDQRRWVWGGEARTVRCCLRSFIARMRGEALVVFCSLYLSNLFFFRKQSQAPQFYLTSGAPAAALAGRTRPRRSRGPVPGLPQGRTHARRGGHGRGVPSDKEARGATVWGGHIVRLKEGGGPGVPASIRRRVSRARKGKCDANVGISTSRGGGAPGWVRPGRKNST